MYWLRRFTVSIVASVLFCQLAVAQKGPQLGYMYPPVVVAGETAEVRIGGYDWTEDMQFFAHHPNMELTIDGELSDFYVPKPPFWFGEKGMAGAMPLPREYSAKLTVPKDAGPGLYRWQVANACGVSGAATFMVSSTPVIIESRHRDQPQLLAQYPIGVCGRLSKIAEIDRYRFVPKQSGTVRVRLSARALGADFHAVMVVRDMEGNVVLDAADTDGQDLDQTFEVQQGTAYTVDLHDVDYRGHRSYVYHLSLLNVTDSPSEDVEDPTSISSPLSVATDRVFQMTQSREQRFTVQATGKSWYRFSAISRDLGGNVDPEITLLDASDKQLATLDDLPDSSDAELYYQAKQDGPIAVVIRDAGGQDLTSRSFYRLQVEEVSPGFQLTSVPTVALPLGGSSQLAIKVKRLAGFADPITLRVTGLPRGVSVEGDEVVIAKGKNAGNIKITAAPDCEVVTAKLQIIGSAEIDGREVQQLATCKASGNLIPGQLTRDRVDFSMVAVTMKPPFAVHVIDKNRQRAVHRGTTYPAPLVIQREEGYNAPVTLLMAARQSRQRQGIRGPILKVPAEQSDVSYPCFMPEWLATDRTSRMVVHGVGIVKDPSGQPRHLMTAADARVTMILEGALLKIAHRSAEISVRPGTTLQIPIALRRSAKLQTQVDITIDAPPEIASALIAEPLSLSASEQEGQLRIRCLDAEVLQGRWPVTLIAKTMQEDRWPVISQTDIEVQFDRSDESPAGP